MTRLEQRIFGNPIILGTALVLGGCLAILAGLSVVLMAPVGMTMNRLFKRK